MGPFFFFFFFCHRDKTWVMNVDCIFFFCDAHTIEPPTATLAAAIWRSGASARLSLPTPTAAIPGSSRFFFFSGRSTKRGPRSIRSPVADIMTRKVVTCTDTVTVVELMERMTRGRFRHVPVAKRGGLAGVVSIGDVVAMRLEELEDKLMNVEAITASIAHEVRFCKKRTVVQRCDFLKRCRLIL